MPNASNALLKYEAGQSPTTMSALSDSGDHTAFTGTGPWSRRDGFAPVIRPNGLVTGGLVTPAASGTNNLVDVSAGTAYIGGELITFAADTDVAITRATSTDTHIVNSICVAVDTGTTGVISVETGAGHTAASDTRGADGGPALIPVAKVELAQVRTTSDTAAAITESEIYSVVGLHTERSDYPVWDVDYYNGQIDFADDLPLIHTGSLPKAVYASYATPIFADVQISKDFIPPENSYSVSSQQVYGRTIASTSASLNAGSFTAMLENGVTDGLIGLAGQNLWFKFFPDRYQSAYVMAQGTLGVKRSFPAGDLIQAACTVNAEAASTNVGA